MIAEIGAWSNPISPDERTRAAALELCKRRLALADRVGRALLRQPRRLARRHLGRAASRQPQPRHVRADRRHRAGDHRRGRAAADVLHAGADAVDPPRFARQLPGAHARDRPAAVRRAPRPDQPHQQPRQVLRQRRAAAGVLREARPTHQVLSRQGHHARRRADGSPRRGDPQAVARSTTASCSPRWIDSIPTRRSSSSICRTSGSTRRPLPISAVWPRSSALRSDPRPGAAGAPATPGGESRGGTRPAARSVVTSRRVSGPRAEKGCPWALHTNDFDALRPSYCSPRLDTIAVLIIRTT